MPTPIQIPPVYIALLFPCMWIFVLFIISRSGWGRLAERYKTDEAFTGTRIGIISAGINRANYNNSLILKYNEDGIYLKTMLIFRLFHPPLLIPWSEIKEVTDMKLLFFKFKMLSIGEPAAAVIKLRESTYNKLKDAAPMNAYLFTKD